MARDLQSDYTFTAASSRKSVEAATRSMNQRAELEDFRSQIFAYLAYNQSYLGGDRSRMSTWGAFKHFFEYIDSKELDYSVPDGNSKYGLFDSLADLENAAMQRFAHLIHQEIKPNPLLGRIGTMESSGGESMMTEESNGVADEGEGAKQRLLKKKE